MAKYRKRFNDKARAGTVEKRESLKRARSGEFAAGHDREKDERTEDELASSATPTVVDTNSELLIPLSKDEKEKQKMREKLRQEIQVPTTSKMSSKKRKRLDKYIEHQLKREERKALMKKLSESKFDTSLLKSSKFLGAGRETKRQRLQQALEKERRGQGDDDTKELLYDLRYSAQVSESESESELHEETDVDDKAKEIDLPSGKKPSSEEIFAAFAANASNKGKLLDENLPQSDSKGLGSWKVPVKKTLKSAQPKVAYNWRAKLEQEQLRKAMKKKKHIPESIINGVANGDYEDLSLSSDYSSSESASGGEDLPLSKSRASDEESAEEYEEWHGFSDEQVSEEQDESASDDEVESDGEYQTIEEDTSPSEHESRGERFKKWAQEQLRENRDTSTDESIERPTLPKLDGEYIPLDRPEDRESPPPELGLLPPLAQENNRKAFYVFVNRTPEIQEQRLQLPILAEEQRIMEAIINDDCVVICGQTGSGKTTQVPQFLYEAGYGNPNSETPGMIGITQPRRVAAVSMATRVSKELGDHEHKVSYQVRFDSTVKADTSVKFMTDGVLLREMSQDFLLSNYSAIIIDEAHERNVNTDILIGALSRILKLRRKLACEERRQDVKPLKLIIMSATLRVSDFTENKNLFQDPPPILNVEARQYPVSNHFSRKTSSDYVSEASKKTIKIHKRLPPGGILIFMTGRNEIDAVCRKLRRLFPEQSRAKENDLPVRILAKDATLEAEEIDLGNDQFKDIDILEDEFSSDNDDEEVEEGFEEQISNATQQSGPLHVLPLYSLLPTKEQLKIFQEPPAGSRLCVVATNVAETSLTIPGIRYVVDCGRVKERHFEEETGVQSFKVDWISKASADQRSGRAGRTGPGHCYRLYSSAVFESEFPKFSKPEILRMPIEGVVLQMKSMAIDAIENFPFPTPPERDSLRRAERLLGYLGALDSHGSMTDVGRSMSVFPVSPRFARILVVGQQFGCLPYVIAIVAALSIGDPFLSEHELGIEGDQEDASVSKSSKGLYFKTLSKFDSLDPASDAMRLLAVTCAYEYEYSRSQQKQNSCIDFCESNFLRPKSMQEIRKLRLQLSHIVSLNSPGSLKDANNLTLKPPSKQQIAALRQMIATGYIDQIAIRSDCLPNSGVPKSKKIVDVPYKTLLPTRISDYQNNNESDIFVTIHPSSILAQNGVCPDFIIYLSIQRSSGPSGRLRMKPLTSIEPRVLANLTKNTSLITYSKPLNHPAPPKLLDGSIGQTRECWVVPRLGAALGTGDMGWELPPMRVTQRKKKGDWTCI